MNEPSGPRTRNRVARDGVAALAAVLLAAALVAVVVSHFVS